MVSSEIPFSKDLYNIETSQLSGLSVIRFFTATCFRIDVNYSQRNKLQNYTCLIWPKQNKPRVLWV